MARHGGLAYWAPVPLRVTLGMVFLAHGSQKLFGLFGGPGLGKVSEIVASLGFQPAWLWAVMLAMSEWLGGLALLLGLFTRWAVLPLLVVMGVAYAKVHAPHGFFLPQGFEYVWVISGGLLALLVAGSGALSCDARRLTRPVSRPTIQAGNPCCVPPEKS